MRDTERTDGSEKLTRIPQSDAGGEGEHIDEQQEDGGGPARRRESSYRECPSEEKLIKNTSAASELPTRGATCGSQRNSPPIRPGDSTYAISHASAALALKRKYPRVGLWPLLISVQAVELLWIAFIYLGIEHYRVTADAIHLDFLPYSHSVLSGALLALLVWGMGKSAHRAYVGVAIGLGIFSHIVLDIIQHEPNITLLPLEWGPRLGLNLQAFPLADFLVELAFCVGCWKVFGGSRQLLIGIVILNLLFNLPIMFPAGGVIALIAAHPFLLPTIILVQVVVTWTLVWWFGQDRVFLESTRH